MYGWLPSQTPFGPGTNPSLQLQTKPPSVLVHVPLPQALGTLHSFLSERD